MNEQGFYKLDQGELLYAPNYVEGQGYLLIIDQKDTYNYPVGGWIYAESEEAAKAILS